MIWNSPYQTENFSKALNTLGYSTLQVPDLTGHQVFLSNWLSPHLIGWEIDVFHLSMTEVDQKVDYLAFEYLRSIDDWQQMKPSTEDYFSPIIKLPSEFRSEYRNSCWRNIKKAQSEGLQLKLWAKAVPLGADKHYQNLINLFTKTPATIPNFTTSVFDRHVQEFFHQQAADIVAVLSDKGQVIAGAIVLISDDIANLRYSTFDHSFSHCRPMNYLIDQLAQHYHSLNFQALDLSGLSSSTDFKMKGINQFKLGFTHTLAHFRWTRI